MPVTIGMALLTAKAKSLKLNVLLTQKTILFIFLAEAVLLICNIFVFFGVYSIIPYSFYIEVFYLASWLPLAVSANATGSILAGGGLIVAGSALNRLAMSLNGGLMPVYITLSRWTGYMSGASELLFTDGRHTEAHANVKAWFLCDFIDTGAGVLSIGDILIHSYVGVVLFGIIRNLNRMSVSKGA